MMTETARHTSAILSDTSLIGRVLHTLIGYSDEPSAPQVVTYVTALAVIVVLTKAFGSRPGARRKGTPRGGGVSAN
jgi:high-affinity iron transporter